MQTKKISLAQKKTCRIFGLAVTGRVEFVEEKLTGGYQQH